MKSFSKKNREETITESAKDEKGKPDHVVEMHVAKNSAVQVVVSEGIVQNYI
ncbi:hypothetical protein VKA52_17180 [Halobacillus sp. HZG1]|uniref:hypothetical protein n=1 Tax=Halobacillus sp. HZG1 TaxID=3111769 RepID=UPI002DBAE46B|nr:hypothetical protein [Halobacillus sp. HZG1]MEC3885472.1 hypothetical protein [Halobacillus sp. HZG1]